MWPRLGFMIDLKRNIGERISKLRNSHNLTQERLAELVRVERNTIYRWESGSSYPEAKYIEALCRVFGIEIIELMGGPGKEASPTIEALLVAIKELQKENRYLKEKNYPGWVLNEEYMDVWGTLGLEERKNILDSKLLQLWASNDKTTRDHILLILRSEAHDLKKAMHKP